MRASPDAPTLATMKNRELVERAREILGRPGGEDKDWSIAPTKHAELYGESAPDLARILKSSRVDVTCKQFEEAGEKAVAAKITFERTARRTNRAVLATAVVGALVLVAAAMPEFSGRSAVMGVLGVAGVITGGLAGMLMHRIDGGGYLKKWMSRRAKAESHRLGLFELVTAAPKDAEEASEVPLSLLQLEYFRRYQVDVQIAYYKGAGAKHEAVARKNLKLSSVAVFVAAAATGIAGVFGATANDAFATFAAVGVVAAALSAFVARREAITQDGRNAERYERSGEALVKLSALLDEVRDAAAADNRKPMEAFVAAVHEHLSVEHRQWIEAAESTSQAMTKLKKELEAAQPG